MGVCKWAAKLELAFYWENSLTEQWYYSWWVTIDSSSVSAHEWAKEAPRVKTGKRDHLFSSHVMQKSTEALLEANREVNLEVKTEKIEYVIVTHHQNAWQNHNLLTANKSCEDVAEFKYLGMTVTNWNCIYKEIKSKLNFGKAWYHSVQNPLSSVSSLRI
jgi:hypothetical protein